MNLWLGIITVISYLIVAIMMYIKQKKRRYFVRNTLIALIVFIITYMTYKANSIYEIIVASLVVGICLLISVIRLYNAIFMMDKYHESIGEIKQPKSFGNWYWH